MYAITYKGKIVTDDFLYRNFFGYHMRRRALYMIHDSKKKAIEAYVSTFGDAWKERVEGVECQKIGVIK